MPDLRYGLRRLAQSPGFSFLVIATLALGIGANTAIFSVIDAVLLTPLPYADPGRLVVVDHFYPSLNNLKAGMSVPGFRDCSGRGNVFASAAVETGWSPNLAGRGEPRRLTGTRVSGGYFGTLGVPVAAGRPLVPGDDQAGHDRVVVLSAGLASRLLGGAANAVGAKLQLSGETYEVVGVASPAFRDARSRTTELWSPLTLTTEQFGDDRRTNEFLQFVGRLQPGMSLAGAQRELTAFAGQLKRQFPDSYPPDWGLLVTSLHEKSAGPVRGMLLILLAAVGFVLLIACTNVANLLLARASGRGREIAVRTALGASRWQLVRQLLIESLLLAAAGGAAGLALAAWALRAAAALEVNGLNLTDLHLSPRVLLFTFAVALATGLLFGVAPALQTARADPQSTLKEGGRSVSAGRGRQALRRGLVVAEIALALALLATAGLLLKSFARLLEVSPGFDPANTLTFNLALPKVQYPTEAQQAAFFERALERLQAVPGVRAAGATSTLPFGGDWSTASFDVEGFTPAPKQPGPWGDIRLVTPGFFAALGVPLQKGRSFESRDAKGAVPVAVVDEEMVRRFWPHQDPLGKRLSFGPSPGQSRQWITVVGVVPHTKHEGLDAEARVQLYLPLAQNVAPAMTIVLRTAVEPRSVLPAVRAALRELDPGLPLSQVHTMSELVESSLRQRRYATLLLGLFAGIALLLAALGIYGVMSCAVAQRWHELGVRMALGAVRGEILGLVLKQGMLLAALGLGAGLLAASAATRLLAGQLYAVQPTDPPTFAAVTTILGGVALLANLLPAFKATRVDPLVALREE